MSSIATQIRALRKQIYIPWTIRYVDHEVKPDDFEEKIIYVHIWI